MRECKGREEKREIKKPQKQSNSGVFPKFSLEALQTSSYYNL